ncbi:MAG: hypothetical protein DME99_03490 [Verrucomicrobia bacterium]|nr:MAG: hypothetical protein DME99_03490 [Verrucomicrobiota bacterium]
MWLQAFSRFKLWVNARLGLLTLGAPLVLVGILVTPSIWMLSVTPPLWRDVDAYGEVTQPPGVGTILLYGPLYCFAARIPLYLGHALGCLNAGGGTLPTLRFFVHPILSDPGVFALLISQHLALCCSTYYLITLTSRVFWPRLILAVAWAVNPLFYTFAHTVGSEGLSMILLLALGATGLSIVRGSGKAPWKEWLLFGILLWLCILTRHINALLAALMPAVFILCGAYQLIVVPFTQGQAFRRSRWLTAKQALQKATLAVAVGLSCIILANASVRVSCYAAQIPYYSTLGLSFLYRLKFLALLPPEKREQLLDEVRKHTASEDVKKVISLVRSSFPAGTSNWDVRDFNEKARALLFARQTDPHGEKYAVLLNRMALEFLYPPHEIFLSAVATDFKRSQQIGIPDVVSFLFVATRFYFSHAGAMPQCASLVTFRDKNADQVFAIFKTHSYFRHPKDLSYRALLFLWLINLALFVVIANMRKQEAAGVASYAAGLTVVGLFMMLANCVLAVFQPRYTLPMWELAIISVSILSAKTLEYIFAGRKQRREVALY